MVLNIGSERHGHLQVKLVEVGLHAGCMLDLFRARGEDGRFDEIRFYLLRCLYRVRMLLLEVRCVLKALWLTLGQR